MLNDLNSQSDFSLKNSSSKSARYCRFVEFLNSIREKIPFNISEIALALEYTLEEVVQYFNWLRKSFRLFHNLQAKKILKSNDLFSQTQKEPINLSLNHSQLKSLATFYYLSSKKNYFPKNHEMKQMIDDFPYLFEQKTNGWQTSEIGEYFADQFIKLNRINSSTNMLNYKNIILKIRK